jgi:hypothetical protein
MCYAGSLGLKINNLSRIIQINNNCLGYSKTAANIFDTEITNQHIFNSKQCCYVQATRI